MRFIYRQAIYPTSEVSSWWREDCKYHIGHWDMTQDEKWIARYNEVKDFIQTNHRNPSKHFVENRNLLSWVKQQRKLLNAGALKSDRVEVFKKLMEIWEENRRVNQYQ